MAEGAYKGPRSNRRMLNKNTVFVSKEELADFKKRFGADKTLRDLLNADKTGKLPEAAKASAAKAGPRRSEAKDDAAKGAETLERMKSRAERGMRVRSNEEMRDRFRDEAIGYGTAAAGLAAGPLARAAMGGRASKTASMARTEPGVGRPVTSRLDDAAAAFSRPQAAQVSKETGRRFTAAQEREAAEAAVRGAAARKEMAAKRAGRSRAMEEAKTQRMMRDEKKKPSPRSRTRDEEDIEFSYGGMAKKKRK
jgi:hypothetical protein